MMLSRYKLEVQALDRKVDRWMVNEGYGGQVEWNEGRGVAVRAGLRCARTCTCVISRLLPSPPPSPSIHPPVPVDHTTSSL